MKIDLQALPENGERHREHHAIYAINAISVAPNSTNSTNSILWRPQPQSDISKCSQHPATHPISIAPYSRRRYLRNVPPPPQANYAQRAGRAVRSGRAAVMHARSSVAIICQQRRSTTGGIIWRSSNASPGASERGAVPGITACLQTVARSNASHKWRRQGNGRYPCPRAAPR